MLHILCTEIEASEVKLNICSYGRKQRWFNSRSEEGTQQATELQLYFIRKVMHQIEKTCLKGF